jgi:hypothetical protein
MSEISLPLAEVVERIQAFEHAPSEDKVDTIRALVNSHLIMSLTWGDGWRFRRARVLHPGQMVHSVDDLIWRAGVPARVGRANAAGFGVIYLGDRRDTALREIHTEDDDVVMSEFSIRSDRTMMVAPIGEQIQVQRTGRGFLAGEYSPEITRRMNAMEPSEGKAMVMIDAFLLDVLTSAEDNYDLSSEVAVAIFDKVPHLDSVCFPSKRQFGALNFAVRIERFWDRWGVVAVQRAHVRHLAQGFYHLTEGRDVIGIYRDGTLEWDSVIHPAPDGVMKLEPPWFAT